MPEDFGDFTLFQLLVFEDVEDMESDLRARQKLVGVLEAQIREDVPGTLFELLDFRFFLLTRQLRCFGVSLLNQVDIWLRGFNAFLRFLRKGMQHKSGCRICIARTTR